MAATAAPTLAKPGTYAKPASFWVGAWHRFRRVRMATFGLVYVIFITVVAVGASVLAPYPFDKIDTPNGLQGPSAQHWMGTDVLGRDILSRVMWGARPMLLVGVLTGLASMAIGVALGILAGYDLSRVPLARYLREHSLTPLLPPILPPAEIVPK